MIRSLIVLPAAVALALAGTAAVAGASPSPAPPCAYTLSPPQVVQLSGTNVVTATLTPAACDRSDAYLLVACVQMHGSDGPGQCAQGERDSPGAGVLPAIPARSDVRLHRKGMFVEGQSADSPCAADPAR